MIYVDIDVFKNKFPIENDDPPSHPFNIYS